ncbi:MAG: DUF3459 domain-containing protein [Anaerolineae bacterium]|nr:DUF3459 domain-containing protein [Anaerolineae bacterium]
MSNQPLLWWRHGVVYQIYPRSFMDSNGDGIGDLRGITKKMDYLSNTLGIDAIWLSPFYKSPMDDFGYDVADYCDVDPIFGTLADFDALITAAHAQNLKVIVDFVPNHSSDQHQWFIESRSSRDNPKRDWYTWRDAKPDGSPPNNWLAVFGGSAWEWDEKTQQYYLHSFLPSQPDLNWRNPEVKAAMFEAMRFWMRRGVDGFRVDVAHYLMKDPDLRDNPLVDAVILAENTKSLGGYDSQQHLYDKGHSDNHELYRQFRGVLDEFEAISPRYSVGEIHIFDWEEWATYYGAGDELHMPFNFGLIYAKWKANVVRDVVESVERVLTKPGQWPNYVFSNHDEHRISSRYGADAARSIMMVLLTLRGTPTMYYGDELGMKDVSIPPEKVQDPWELRVPGANLGRDPERTPMQWDATPNAGFSPAGVETWLPIGEDYSTVNVEAELQDARSMLNMTRALLRLRRGSEALLNGSYRTAVGTPEEVYAYVREASSERYLILINFAADERTVSLPELASGQVVISTLMDRDDKTGGSLKLRPNEGCVVRF